MNSKSTAQKYAAQKYAIVTSEFNREVTDGLRAGALEVLAEHGIKKNQIVEVSAPGAFEIPLIARALAKRREIAGVICLGCVIKGDTAHFEFISLAATLGILQTTLELNKPITFGILTTYTDEQAKVRSAVKGKNAAHNKGKEAASACLKTVQTLAKIN